MEKETKENNINNEDGNNGRITINLGKDLKNTIQEYCKKNNTNFNEYGKNILLESISKSLNNSDDCELKKDIDFTSEKARVESFIESIINIISTLENSANSKCEEIRTNANVDNEAIVKLSSNLSDALEEANKKNEELEDSNLLLSRTAEDQLEEIKSLNNQIDTKNQLIASFKFNEAQFSKVEEENKKLKIDNETLKKEHDDHIRMETEMKNIEKELDLKNQNHIEDLKTIKDLEKQLGAISKELEIEKIKNQKILSDKLEKVENKA